MKTSTSTTLIYTITVALGIAFAACNDAHDDETGQAASFDSSVTDIGFSEFDSTTNPNDLTVAQPTIRNVGYSRSELLYQAPDGERELPLHFWYPTTDEDGNTVRYDGFLASEGAFKDATPHKDLPVPVMLFSHGMRGFAAATAPFLAEHFAKNGWLVVSWSHTGDTTGNASDRERTYLHRPLDVSAVLDFLYADEAAHLYAGSLSETVLLTGHSRGGYTCFSAAGATFPLNEHDQLCAMESDDGFCSAFNAHRDLFAQGFLDERVNGLIVMASGEYNRFQDGLSNVQVPTLLWTADRDLNNPNEVDGDPIWNALLGPNMFRFDLVNAGHFTFTSLCGFIGPLGENNGCDPNNFPVDEAHTLVNDFSLLFARAFLTQDTSALDQFSNIDASNLDTLTFSKKDPP